MQREFGLLLSCFWCGITIHPFHSLPRLHHPTTTTINRSSNQHDFPLQRMDEPINSYTDATLRNISLIDDSKVSTPHYLARLLRELRLTRHVTHPYIRRLLHAVPAPKVEDFNHA